jgi:hypothetical protein
MVSLSGKISEPAWRARPSWYLIATDDKMIPPDAQRAMSKRAGSTVVEVKGSHAIYVSQPGASQSLSKRPPEARRRQRIKFRALAHPSLLGGLPRSLITYNPGARRVFVREAVFWLASFAVA